MQTTIISAPFGFVKIACSDSAVVLVERAPTGLSSSRRRPSSLCADAAAQLMEYFSGERMDFTLPLELQGTGFQLDVWRALRSIPYGETRTYGQIAAAIGNPKAARAVGMANNRNPISIIVPCHRVVGSTGKLVGYGGGLDMKQWLLEIERAHLRV